MSGDYRSMSSIASETTEKEERVRTESGARVFDTLVVSNLGLTKAVSRLVSTCYAVIGLQLCAALCLCYLVFSVHPCPPVCSERVPPRSEDPTDVLGSRTSLQAAGSFLPRVTSSCSDDTTESVTSAQYRVPSRRRERR